MTDSSRLKPRITLPHPLLEQIEAHARATPHVEVCGLVAARNGQPTRCVAIRNVAEQPQRHFLMDPKQQIDAFRSMRERGEQLFAIYHSHPQGPAGPSQTDLLQAAYPEALQIIASPDAGGEVQLRCYRFMDGTVQELRLST